MDSISIFRIKDGLTDPDRIVKGRGFLWSGNVKIGKAHFGVLYAKKEALKAPSWFSYFAGAVDFSDLKLRTGGSSAVLLVKRGGQHYAITFGYGFRLVHEDAIEPRFGLRATLNAIEPSKIRSIDHKRLEAISRHTREQVSRASAIRAFGLDVERDLLSAATGTPVDPSRGRLIAGRDQLTVVGTLPLDSLPGLIDHYEAVSKSEQYKQAFPWVDNIAEVTDPTARASLNEALAAELQGGMHDRIWLSPPDIIDYHNHAGFAYLPYDPDSPSADLNLGTWLSMALTKGPITVQRLRTDRVASLHATDHSSYTSWQVLHCIVAELDRSPHTYALNDGKWYRIDAAFLDSVNSFVSSLSSGPSPLPLYADADEGAYNLRAATTSKGALSLFDKVFPKNSPYGKLEVCDLYSVTKQLIHVKRYYSSATLSHLFNQGLVSGEALVQDPVFRTQFNDLLPDALKWPSPAAALGPQEFEVVYAVIFDYGKKHQLPFFSRVALRNTAKALQRLGLRVGLHYIPTHKPSNVG